MNQDDFGQSTPMDGVAPQSEPHQLTAQDHLQVLVHAAQGDPHVLVPHLYMALAWAQLECLARTGQIIQAITAMQQQTPKLHLPR